jgi:putative FmdB family regulatory protein
VPTYQYACTECGHAFEQVQSFSDDALTECPACSGRLRKVFNAVGVVFKGSGFYRTDSRAGGPGSPGSSPASAPAASGEPGASSPAPAAAGEKKASGGDTKPAASSVTTSSAD